MFGPSAMPVIAIGIAWLVGQARGAIGDICFIVGANSALFGNRLYFMGGNYSITTPVGQEMQPRTSLFWVELNDALPVQGLLPQSAYVELPIPEEAQVAYSNAGTGVNEQVAGSTGALWQTNDTIYVFGGVTSTVMASTVSAYDVGQGTWRDAAVAGGGLNFGTRSGAQTVSVRSSGVSYLFGGFDPRTPGMVTFEASDPANLSWSNDVMPGMPQTESGNMVYVPAGDSGLLVSFGGNNGTEGINPNVGLGRPNDADWSLIYVYDMATQTWWKQRASGDVPRAMAGACAVVTVSPDDSAFHITIYGAWSLADERAYESVYILSLPSFTWINATDIAVASDSPRQAAGLVGTSAAQCQVYNNSQMLVLGGTVRSGWYWADWMECRSEYAPLRVLDLSTYQWQARFDSSKQYRVPGVVYDEIGGDESGRATKTAPSAGWVTPALSAAMMKRLTPSSSASEDQSPDQPAGKTESKPVAAVAGGVVGGVVLLALLAGLGLWYFRRGSKRRDNTHQAPPAGLGGRAELDTRPTDMLEAKSWHEMNGQIQPREADSGAVYELYDGSAARGLK